MEKKLTELMNDVMRLREERSESLQKIKAALKLINTNGR